MRNQLGIDYNKVFATLLNPTTKKEGVIWKTISVFVRKFGLSSGMKCPREQYREKKRIEKS